jgi:hypothetical protein
MANKTDQTIGTQWVADRIAALSAPPELEVNVEMRLREVQDKDHRRQQRRRAVAWTLSSVTLSFLLLLSFPSNRARAQLLFQRFVLKGIQIVGVRPDLYSTLLFEWTIRPVPAHMVSGPDEAAKQAGFVPNLPDWTMVSQPVPSFGIGVMGAGAGNFDIRVSDLRSALSRAGAGDVTVPDSWDGARIGVEISPTIYVNARGFMLIQFLPGRIETPPGFSIEKFFEVLLRIGSVPAPNPRIIAERMGRNPTALLGFPDPKIETREIALRSGTGILMENIDGHNPPRGCVLCPALREVVLAWQTPSRFYILKTELNEASAIEVANSLP